MFERIIVGSDGSKTAQRAVDRAVEVARTLGAHLTIASAGEEAKARQVVEAEAARHASSGVQIATEVLEGDPATALVERAEFGNFDLLVVGNKGMTGVSLQRFLGTSVGNRVSHHAPCSVLIARTT